MPLTSCYWTSQSQRLTADARRAVLAQFLTEFLRFCHEDRYRFSDVLQAFSDYASGQISDSPIWSVVADVLNLAAQNVLVAFERPAVRNRQAIQRSLAEFIEAVHGDGYTFADVIRALVEYCLTQRGNGKKKQKHTWENIAILLDLAAVQAEQLSQSAGCERAIAVYAHS